MVAETICEDAWQVHGKCSFPSPLAVPKGFLLIEGGIHLLFPVLECCHSPFMLGVGVVTEKPGLVHICQIGK